MPIDLNDGIVRLVRPQISVYSIKSIPSQMAEVNKRKCDEESLAQ